MIGQCFIVLAILAQAGQDAEEKPKTPPPQPPAAEAPAPKAPVNLADLASGEFNLQGVEFSVEAIGPDTVIITATEDILEQLEKLVRILDLGIAPRSIKVFKLENAQATNVAPMLQQAFQAFADKGRGRQVGPEDQVDIQADTRSNSLIVIAAESRMELVETLVKQLDSEPSLPVSEVQTFPLKHIKAETAEQLLTEMLAELDTAKNRQKNYSIRADARTNSLFVIAPETDLKQIKHFIDLIDVKPVEGTAETFIIPLKHADANDLADVINEMITSADQKDALKEQISRLRLRKTTVDGQEGEPIELDLEKPLRITGDEQTNSLIVATHESNVVPIREIVKLLDNVPIAEEMFIRIFPLEYADSTNLSEMLTELFEQGQELAENAGRSKEATKKVPEGPAGKAMVYNVTISADTRTNTIIVAGRLEQVMLAQTLIDNVDVAGVASKFPVELITLQDADAATIAQIIQDLNEQRLELLQDQGKTAVERERIFVQPDPRINALIVSAKEDNVKEIRELVKKLDLPPDRLIDQIHILTLKNLTASDLGTKIESLWDRRVQQRQERGVPEDRPIIVTDSRSNSLVIAANRDDFNAIKMLVDKLEKQELAPISEIRLITLENNDAGALGPVLENLFEQRAQQRLAPGQQEQPSDRVAIAADPASNTLLVACSKENFDEMDQLVKTLDGELDTEGVLQIFMLENADASNVASTIESLFTEGVYKSSAGLGGELSAAQEKVAIIPDPRSNSIIASGSKPNLAIIKSLVEHFDSLEAPKLMGDTMLFKLKHADAVKLGDMLDELFQGIEQNMATQDFKLGMTVIADQVANMLLIAGSRDGLQKAKQLIEKLDVESGDVPNTFRIFQLEHTASVRLAPMVQELFDQRQEGTAAKATPFYVQADESSNTLIVSASAEDQRILEDLLAMLDVQSTVASQFKIFPLKLAKAVTIVETLQELFAQQQRLRGTSGGGRGDSQVIATNIAADERTNAILVWASPTDLENIEKIIQELDKSDPAQELSVEVLRLKQALAEDIAELLTAAGIAAGEERSTRTADQDARAYILSYFDEDEQGELIERKLLQQDIRIIPEPRTNSLLMMAPPDSMEMLKSFIANLDEIKPITAEIKVFALQNADAQEMADTLEELFEAEESGRRRSSDEEPEVQLTLGGSLGASLEAGGRQELSFTVDSRTNSVIAAGTPEYLELVERLILELDSKDIEERMRQVYKVKFVTAEDLADTLNSFLEEEVELYQETEEEMAVQRRLQREVTVVADEPSNSLLLNYDPRMQSQIATMIDELDQPPPQVMIQVLLAEVGIEESLDFGIEFAIQDLLFSETAVVGPNGTIKGNNFDFIGGTDIGAAGAAGSFGGFSFTITGEDFSFLLRALQGDTRLEILSRPTIMARDNEEASINVGQRVPFVRGVTIVGGQSTSSVEYEEIGINLTVTPHINPDGWVSIEVAPEISTLTDSTIQISEGLTAPIFNSRTAETVVYVKDGETVVIGGLIETTDLEAEVKVPILGDIPYLGALFKSTQVSKIKRELLIILTPRVVRAERDMYELSIEERDKDDLLPDRVKQSPLMEKLRLEPGQGEDTLDMDIDQHPERHKPPEISPDAYRPSPAAYYGPPRPDLTEQRHSRADEETLNEANPDLQIQTIDH